MVVTGDVVQEKTLRPVFAVMELERLTHDGAGVVRGFPACSAGQRNERKSLRANRQWCLVDAAELQDDR
jgi:hypothetical protein